MEQKKIKTVFRLLFTTMFLAACSSQTNTPPVASQTTQARSIPSLAPTQAAPSQGVPATGEGLCANAYYPVRQGTTWNYKSSGGSAGEYSFTDTITSVRQDGFTLSTQFDKVTRTQEWACQPEGLVALEFGGAPAAMLDAQNMQLDVQASNFEGVTLPSAPKPGDTWQHSLALQGKASVGNESGTGQGTAQNNFMAVGTESVTVPAGTFDALKIQVTTTLDMSLDYNGLTVPVVFAGSYTYWFAPGVGWVKASGTGNAAGIAFSETIELQSYNIP